MEKFSKKAAAVLNGERLQVINADIWHDLQDPRKLRCEFHWLDECCEQITVEVPLYKAREAQDKIGHSCCINIVCPNGAFIPSAINIYEDGHVTFCLPYEPLIQNGEFNTEALYETNVIATRNELLDIEFEILKALE